MTVAAPDPRNIIGHVPGRLCVGATDLSTAYPHGGTALGEIEDAVLVREAPTQILTAEEYGIEPHAAIAGGESWSLACSLREWNAEAYSRIFLNAEAGAVSGHTLVKAPGTNRAGENLAGRAAVFVFSPRNSELHPFVVFYAGIPMVSDTANLRLALGGQTNKLTVPVVILGIRDGSDRLVEWGRAVDLAL